MKLLSGGNFNYIQKIFRLFRRGFMVLKSSGFWWRVGTENNGGATMMWIAPKRNFARRSGTTLVPRRWWLEKIIRIRLPERYDISYLLHSSRVEKTDSYRKYFVFNQCGLKFRSIMSNKGNLEVEIARLATSARLKLLERQNSMSCNLCFSLLNYRIMLWMHANELCISNLLLTNRLINTVLLNLSI